MGKLRLHASQALVHLTEAPVDFIEAFVHPLEALIRLPIGVVESFADLSFESIEALVHMFEPFVDPIVQVI